MSKIHSALKGSADKAPDSFMPEEPAFSSLDKKLISAGASSDIIVEAHKLKKNNGTGFFDYLI
ncbi:MAG: hypothetical protein APR62_11160, partial [Smithella sp. SDB]